MNVSELIDVLADLQVDGFGDAEVRIATQPSWPLAFSVDRVAAGSAEEASDPNDDFGPDADADVSVVWIATGEHPADAPYAPRSAWEGR